jgi:UDP-GlcNAc3NAcA epimerase
LKVVSIIGARPQFVKVAMVAEAVQRYNRAAAPPKRIRHRLIHTGQHYEYTMSGVFFEELRLPEPDHYLGVGSGPQGEQTAAMLKAIEKVLQAEKPDYVIVYGDTNSTLAGSLAAAKLHIPVAHLEAGLRSFNRRMPEEVNRVVSDHLANILLCPTKTAMENLRKEGITGNTFLTGDVMLDAVLVYREKARRRTKLLQTLGIQQKEYALATLHRAENTDSTELLTELLETLANIQHPVVLPLHPRVRDRLKRTRQLRALAKTLDRSSNLRIIEPVSYVDMILLETNARVVLTDSGGVQKEAFFLGTPCVTLRKETEWLETLEGGWNRVIGTSPAKIREIVESVWSNNGATPHGQPKWKSFGDGHAADKTVEVLVANSKSGK